MNWGFEDAEAVLFLLNTKRAAEQRNRILECTVRRSDYGSSGTDLNSFIVLDLGIFRCLIAFSGSFTVCFVDELVLPNLPVVW
jgi:hypothetical protein